MKNKGLKPAFPFIEKITGNYGEKYWQTTPGQSKRFYAACAAMQGLLANPNWSKDQIQTEAVVKVSLGMADELIKQEE